MSDTKFIDKSNIAGKPYFISGIKSTKLISFTYK